MVSDQESQVRTFGISFFPCIAANVATGKYGEHYDHWSKEDEERPRGIGSTLAAPPTDPPPVAVDRNLTGDEAFQRRLALSARMRPLSPPVPSVEVNDENFIPGLSNAFTSAVPSAETGDEAYLRRVAISTVTRTGLHNPPSPVPEPAPIFSPPSPPTLAYNPFAPRDVPPPPPGPPGSFVPNALDDKVKAAAAIAAKLGALAGTAGTTPPGPTSVEDKPQPSDK